MTRLVFGWPVGGYARQVAPPPPLGGVPDPTLLPIASGQAQNTAAYNALNIPGMAAGTSYLDPVVGTRVYKCSSVAFTPGDDNQPPHYAEFGPHISCPWIHPSTGRTMYTLSTLGQFTGGRLIDFDYTLALTGATGVVANWRACPWDELEMGFSFNLATPRICYYSSGGPVTRLNTDTMLDANIGNFPGPTLADREFMLDKNDAWFVGKTTPDEVVHTWNSVTDQEQNWGVIGNEPKLDRNGGFIYGINSSIDYVQGSLSAGPPWSDVFPANWAASHEATPANGLMMVADPSTPDFATMEYWDPVTLTRTRFTQSVGGCWAHGAGQWVHGNGSGLLMWVVVSIYDPCGTLSLAVGYMRFDDLGMTNVRLLCHHYSDAQGGNDYFAQPHATPSPDGKIILFGSNMLVTSGRVDSFVALVPTS
jgi:hypothetical protein